MFLKEFLRGQSLTVADFAKEMGVTHCVANRWVKGLAIPRDKSMEKIIKFTGGAVLPNDFYSLRATENKDC